LGNVAWWGVIKAGWPVLSVLLAMSIVTVAVVWEKWKAMSRIQVDSAPFLESIRKAGDPAKIISFCEKSDQPLAYITRVIYKTVGRREDRDRNLHRAIQQLVHQVEVRISVLGTIASIAPFIGLLGTVVGIIKSFRAVSMSSSGGAGLVALGIAEALVGTAAGLLVAIPALVAYNFFVNKLRRLIQEWEIVGSEVIDLAVHTQGS
jgi:biopolymer transport protein ExbB/TolQ